jgi:hypothetical protein
MTEMRLELVIRRKGRKEDTLAVTADPANPEALRLILTGWLDGEGWAKGRWGEFEMEVFAAGTSKRLARVRT